MHKQNIETLRSEAQRLIDIEVHLFDEMKNNGLIAKKQEGEIQTFDQDNLPKYLEILSGEATKLKDLEMVLAVVGTMKAGKSTTINAIVGTEILPNRNRPMTALPTLIRHVQGQSSPILKFDNDKPILRLIQKLRQKIQNPAHKSLVNKLKKDGLDELIQVLISNKKLQQRYEGADQIFEFLKSLNDLVRIAPAFDIEFPFSDYDEIHELPVIEVEFVHLRENNQSQGKLTLLDTPGPNEAGQSHLKKMLKEQLSKASAVLAVLDYTQLKSDADAQVRDNLQEIATISEGRLYALVNKFDQKDRHSDSADDVKHYVAESLMRKSLPVDKVFPVSSKWGYLANRARHELSIHVKLPDFKEQAWVKDFGEELFGALWENLITDPEYVKKGANKLWENSLFEKPLEDIIKTAHTNAAIFAIDSAAAKLLDIAQKMNTFLSTRTTALTKSVQELRKQIKGLQQDIQQVDETEKSAKQMAGEMLKQLYTRIQELYDKNMKEVLYDLKYYFDKGLELENQHIREYKKKIEEEKKRLQKTIAGIFKKTLMLDSTNTEQTWKTDCNSEREIITFYEHHEAKELIGNIENSLNDIFSQTEDDMKSDMNAVIEAFQDEFTDNVQATADKILQQMTDRLEEDGFTLELNTPDTSKLSLGFTGGEMFDDLVQEKTKTVTRSRRSSGAWGTICGWFGTSDWGWENYDANEEYFEIDINKIETATILSLENTFDGFKESIGDYVRDPLNKSIQDFFSDFKQIVEQIKGDMLQSIRDKELGKSELDALMSALEKLKTNVSGTLNDAKELKADSLKFHHNEHSAVD